LKQAGLFIQRESQKIVPVEFGLLKNSARTRSEGKGFDTAVIVSYGTSYAIYVHENLGARHKLGKSAKFLEIPIRTKQKEIIDIIMGAVARKGKGRGKGWRKGKKGKAKGQ
jgi:hypothetical protein